MTMSERKIDYVSISRFSRGYAGKIIDEMTANDSVIFVMRNNEPTAVIMRMEEYQNYMNMKENAARISKPSSIKETAGSLHAYADPEKMPEEKNYYQKALAEKYGK